MSHLPKGMNYKKKIKTTYSMRKREKYIVSQGIVKQ